tara:strand:+ start:1257 stop:1604 length:348 start_codon:yes stop_codon:yes gene_type:complete
MIKGYHKCFGKWSIDGNDKLLLVKDLYPKCVLRKINFEDISYKRNIKQGIRYEEADYRYPCLVTEGIKNPDCLRYRLIDGRHRIQKMIDHGFLNGIFFVIPKEDFLNIYNNTENE